MLSFQLTSSGKVIQIHCDKAGAEILASALKKIEPTGGHIHLRSPSAGGHDLSEKTPFEEPAIGEVILTWAGD